MGSLGGGWLYLFSPFAGVAERGDKWVGKHFYYECERLLTSLPKPPLFASLLRVLRRLYGVCGYFDRGLLGSS